MMPKTKTTITSQKVRTNNLIVLVEFELEFPSNDDSTYFLS